MRHLTPELVELRKALLAFPDEICDGSGGGGGGTKSGNPAGRGGGGGGGGGGHQIEKPCRAAYWPV